MSCGHEENWAEKIDEDYMCPGCMLVCRDAVGCECGKLFCEVAAKQWKASCPNCRKETKKTPENFIRKKLANLKLHCPLSCGATLRLADKDAHMHQYCPNRLVPCPKCQMTTSCAGLEKHQQEECPNRSVICPDCHVEVSVKYIQHHRTELCVARLTSCPVCKREVRINAIMEHLEANVGNHFMALVCQHLLLQEQYKALEAEVAQIKEKLYGYDYGFNRSPPFATTTVVGNGAPPNYAGNGNNTAQTNNNHAPQISMQGPASLSRSNKIFVGGIAPETTLEEFQKYFLNFGGVADAVVMTDRETGRPRGFGFVTFEREESADLVVQQQQHVINDKVVECKKAVPKEHTQKQQQQQQSEDSTQSPSVSSEETSALVGGADTYSDVDERFSRAVKEGLFRAATDAGSYYYTGPLLESGHANFCDRFTKQGGGFCCCRNIHAENYIKTQILCKHGASCRFGRESCGFVHLSTESKTNNSTSNNNSNGSASSNSNGSHNQAGKGECNRGYFCSVDCPYQHHPEALKVWKKRGKGGYPRGFRLQPCAYGNDCKNKTTCTFYHAPREAFCSNCSRIGHPAVECKAGGGGN